MSVNFYDQNCRLVLQNAPSSICGLIHIWSSLKQTPVFQSTRHIFGRLKEFVKPLNKVYQAKIRLCQKINWIFVRKIILLFKASETFLVLLIKQKFKDICFISKYKYLFYISKSSTLLTVISFPQPLDVEDDSFQKQAFLLVLTVRLVTTLLLLP